MCIHHLETPILFITIPATSKRGCSRTVACMRSSRPRTSSNPAHRPDPRVTCEAAECSDECIRIERSTHVARRNQWCGADRICSRRCVRLAIFCEVLRACTDASAYASCQCKSSHARLPKNTTFLMAMSHASHVYDHSGLQMLECRRSRSDLGMISGHTQVITCGVAQQISLGHMTTRSLAILTEPCQGGCARNQQPGQLLRWSQLPARSPVSYSSNTCTRAGSFEMN